ncbi:substrate-binding domain-containing protein [Arthrobacter sp. MMS18-M83]|uniref:substrate-binding domain-containing protein n=1 Tax=Arthrobacter sp. MMS18-M83 TaxID=2996261 RepID=UPI002279F55B|nr:substrate-binding domain-containing protein [Arthrobacter sp. MMS18-M83]WAH96211.1 substrate-binding domain-containing protein [Arthrobacter sp. MMS18-M83]
MKLTFKKSGLAAVAIAAVAVLGLSACSGSASTSTSSSSLADGLGSNAKNRTVYFLTYYDPSTDPFWNDIYSGAKDAAQIGNLKLVHQTAASVDTKMVDLVETAIATKPAMIVMPFNAGEAWVKAACDAKAAGIPVMAYNVPPPADGTKCVLGFVGQDFRAVGNIIGKSLISQVNLKPGDKVLLPAEHADQPYAVARGGGVNDALTAAGLNQGTFLTTKDSETDTLNILTSWLVANKDVKAIVPLGGTPHRMLVKAEDAAGVTAPIIGFDTSPQVIAGIKSGRILGTADQQGYVQGFQSVMQGTLNLDFGLSAANINSGGNALITKDNVGNLEAKNLQGVRY